MTKRFSSSVKILDEAFAGDSLIKKKLAIPTAMLRAPSMTRIQRHPRHPCRPSSCPIAKASKPENAPELAISV